MKKTRDAITDIWGKRTPFFDSWPERIDQLVTEEPDRWVSSACVLCSNGCALEIGVKSDKIVGVRGIGSDRVNRGRLGPKGLNGWTANNSSDRLTAPLKRQGNGFIEISWDEAITTIADRCKKVIEDYSPLAIAFYTSGQLFLEEYFTLSTIAKAGLGTNHVDGNTRLCTATAAQAMKETFGSDGQPGSYRDLDTTECIVHAGHNISETQTVLWARILDRRRGPNPPRLIVIDPRCTKTAQEADVHLAPKIGTNVAVINGLLNLLIINNQIDTEFIEKHTVGFQNLKDTVSRYTPQVVQSITNIPTEDLERAAHLIGTADSLVSTVLQGFYQANQATAAACQVNNLNLLRGMIGKPGCGILQMNGQPTAQNTRETGCDGGFPVFANWQNQEHMRRLADRWNVDESKIPSWHDPTHALEIFRHVELGIVKMLWTSATNPAVSMPELKRVRKILQSKGLFLVVQDIFMTETAELADIVLPAAMWGEKQGSFTNADRTVHLSEKATNPPGHAKSDLEIFMSFARAMNFKDKDGKPLIKWTNAEEAFDAWARFTRDCFCDYSGLSYEKLRRGSGIQWPCNEKNPAGTERLYTDHVFRTASEVCQTFGHELETGAGISKKEYQADDPEGKAFLKSAEYVPFLEEPDSSYPFALTTGRVVYQFHTRTKTGRSKELNEAAPECFIEISQCDASKLGIESGDLLEVSSRRGKVQVVAKITGIISRHLFMPFHYGTWDNPERHAAANELTVTACDPVSKQPHFKFAAANIRKVPIESSEREIEMNAEQDIKQVQEDVEEASASYNRSPRSRIGEYIARSFESNKKLKEQCEQAIETHFEEVELQQGLKTVINFCLASMKLLRPFYENYSETCSIKRTSLESGPLAVLHDLQSMLLTCSNSGYSLTVLEKAARANRAEELVEACRQSIEFNRRGEAWLKTQLEHRAAETVGGKW